MKMFLLGFFSLLCYIGEVVFAADDDTCLVQWHDYKTAWYASRFDLEVLLCE